MEKIVHISGEIGWEIIPSEFKQQVDQLNLEPKDTLRVVINSGGGSVFDGFDIYNTLKSLNHTVVTEVRGLAASIASLIMLAGDRIEMSEASMVMIHRSMTMVAGNSEEIEKQTKVLKSIDDILVSVYSNKTGKDSKEVEELLSEETWFTGEEAVEAGLADELINKVDAKFAASLMFNPKQKKMALADLFKKLRNETVTDEEVQEAVENQELEIEESENPTEEATNIVTREEFDALVAAMEQLASAIDGLTVEEETEEKEAPAEEETPPAEEEASADTNLTVEELEEVIENKVRGTIASLKKSKGKVPKGNNSLTGTPNGYVDKYAGFRAEQAELDAKTRN